MKAISGLDATFLYTETPTSPMHVGSVAIIEGSLEFDTFRKIILSRLHLIPTLRKRLVQVPFSIDYPYWVDDPNFDPDMHLRRVALPQPGGWRELRDVASHIFSEALDRSRPLWSFTFVEGLENIPQVPKGSVAIVSKIHHVAIDGMAGAGILSLLFDLSPKAKEIPEPQPFKAEPLPDEFSLFINSALSFASKPLKFPKLISDTLTATIKAGFLTRVQKIELPTAPFTAPPSPLNGIISARRKWNTAILSLERIKALKTIMETTLNDIMLAICAGALRRYLLEKGKLPVKPLVAMVPISTRGAFEKQEPGNQISSMLIQLATNIEDPIERLEVIYENTIRGKTYQGAIGAKTLADMAEAVPFGIANQAARIYSRYKISEMHNPVFNVTITNVPGPQVPLYINGHKLISVMGMAPIIDGMGLIITIFSYNGLVTISPTSDAKTMPDIDTFTRYIRESANELEAAVHQYAESRKNQDEENNESLESDKYFEKLKNYFKENTEKLKEHKGVFQFQVQGAKNSAWKIDLNKNPASIRKGNVNQADAIFIIQDQYLQRIAQGELDLSTALIQGRLRIEGDQEKAQHLGKLLSMDF
ncbi:MAG: wax ester/triacylglycerol synthase family O-acyltransferase [Microscillaceae bacterium]|nr:wax ester/triacylglycerol synthase family O-acyltransferase [Microscillaceae bacterium]